MQHLQTQTKIYALQKNIIEVIEDFTNSFNSLKTKQRYQTVLKQFFELLEMVKLEELSDIHITEVKKCFDEFRESKSKFDLENKSGSF